MAERKMCSRRDAERYISAGDVYVNGEQIQQDWIKIPRDSCVEFSGKAVKAEKQKVSVILNKPLGYVSSQPEPMRKPAIELLSIQNAFQLTARWYGKEPKSLSKLAVCGRLDINSTGLLLFTQDGVLAKQILDPNGGVEKEYLVRVDMDLERDTKQAEEVVDKLREGFIWNDICYRARSVRVLNANQLQFILTEGKKRHIRYMCEAVGIKVIALKRVRIGNIRLGALPVGNFQKSFANLVLVYDVSL
uniref:Ribosomal large subunit pseudouridine synthase F put n=1 Tax=Albugo laibachii Nc14 TaxID=890382 RepID=F0W490_9STRA|nr:ribosomal large subunit pseudouridine synthase F put [Albugo laibachii Nc14]|eukprot:CCA15906.1 ribosomal large subunit pseudouridine synthase F put [Albugo laibachii Nc14]